MKTKTVSQLHKKLWPLFSKYIRNRGAKDGYNTCITCNKRYEVKLLQAGHFITRSAKAILYDERNVHPQCYNCNINLRGNTAEYFVRLEQMYGRAVVDELIRKKHETKHWTTWELEELIEKYKHGD